MGRGLHYAVMILVAGTLVSAAPRDDKDKAERRAAAQAQFEILKKLAGNWSGKAGHDGGDAFDATVSYRVTSAGNTVMETLFEGTAHEMVTMYHLHGDALILTHYCAAGNQPRMKAAPSENAKKLVFKFLDGTNLDPAKDMHMHEAAIEFVAEDHIRSSWTSYNKGEPVTTAKFDLTRKK